MTKEELAAILNNREIGAEITEAEAEAASEAGLVVIFGASDDLMEFYGAISDEIGCYDGGTAYLKDGKLLVNDCDDEYCPHFRRSKESAVTINAVWNRDGYLWVYDTDISHATFDVIDDGEPYCRGIVFSLADLAEAECRDRLTKSHT